MKKLTFFLALLLIFGLVGCFDEGISFESSQVSEISNLNDTSNEESIDPSAFFPNNMSPNEFVITVRDAKIFNSPDENTAYLEMYYGYKPTSQTRKYIESSKLDLRSIENEGKTGKDAATESHVVMLGDCLLIAIAVYDMEENTAYVVKDSAGSPVMTDDRYYTHTNINYSDESNNGQAIMIPDYLDESGHQMFTLSYGYPVWHFVCKEYNNLTEDYVLTLTEKLYDGDEVVSEEVTLTLTYKDIQELLS